MTSSNIRQKVEISLFNAFTVVLFVLAYPPYMIARTFGWKPKRVLQNGYYQGKSR